MIRIQTILAWCMMAVAPIGYAATCLEPSHAKGNQTLYAVVDSPALSASQHQQLRNFFKRLAKDRDGYSQGYFCKKDVGKVAVENDDVRFRSQSRDDSYEFRISFVGGNYGYENERLNYTLTESKLLMGPNERGNDILILSLSSSKLVTYEKYRQSPPNGGSIVREVVRHFNFAKTLTVSNTYYLNGFLQSENQWVLH